MKILDISVAISPAMAAWPGHPAIALKHYRSLSQGDSSNSSVLSCSVHTGTHVDAPNHFIEGGTAAHELPLAPLVGPAIVADVALGEEQGEIDDAHLEALHLPADTSRLLLRTRNSDLWANPNHPFDPSYVALSTDAAEWIVRRGIQLLGIDYLSVQKFRDVRSRTHHVLLEAGVSVVEGLDLRRITPGAYFLVCLPLKLVGSDGAPARAILIQEI